MNFCYWRRMSAGGLLVVLLCLTLQPVAAKEKGPKQRDIADTINANPIMTKFALMVQASDLGTFLSSKGPFTVFAPTDSAFAKLPPYAFEIMLQPQNKERLQAIVLYHVVNNKRLTALDLKGQKSLLSCQGGALTMKLNRLGAQYVQKAKITHADIKCANGLINQIDSLLMPPEGSLPALAAPGVTPVPASAPTDNSNSAPAATADTNNPPAVPVAPVAAPDAGAH